ncbi:MAG: hypothetical protein IPG72_11580 [Ardenticatenales bacterium]|nr:hypothetical protein [Ardenticatenales bacterium]
MPLSPREQLEASMAVLINAGHTFATAKKGDERVGPLAGLVQQAAVPVGGATELRLTFDLQADGTYRCTAAL